VDARLDRQFAMMERQKNAIVAELSAWSRDRRRFCPSDKQWSALEVIDHLRKTEQGILAEMQREFGISDSPVIVPQIDRVRGFLLTSLFRTQVRVKVPGAATSVLPDRGEDLEVLAQGWGETRLEMARFLDSLPASKLKLGGFRHPVSGWMTVPRTLLFFSAHMEHHRFQLRRLKRASAVR